MKRQGIIIEKVDIPFSKSLKIYLRDWKYVLRCLHPLRNAYDWPEWTSQGEKKIYVDEDHPRFKEAAYYVERYDGLYGTVDLLRLDK